MDKTWAHLIKTLIHCDLRYLRKRVQNGYVWRMIMRVNSSSIGLVFKLLSHGIY